MAKKNNTLIIVLIILGVLLAGYLVASSGLLTGFASRAATQPQCRDGVDNDLDGKKDYPNDPGCTSRKDTTEINPNVECDDGIDNDGDTKKDLLDTGCSSLTDNDETNCGDGKCEGGETSSTCSADCVIVPPPTNNTNTTQPPSNTCTDTDSGINKDVQGTVSGQLNGASYSYTDYCYASNSTFLAEYYCSGGKAYTTSLNCAQNTTTMCSDGKCI